MNKHTKFASLLLGGYLSFTALKAGMTPETQNPFEQYFTNFPASKILMPTESTQRFSRAPNIEEKLALKNGTIAPVTFGSASDISVATLHTKDEIITLENFGLTGLDQFMSLQHADFKFQRLEVFINNNPFFHLNATRNPPTLEAYRSIHDYNKEHDMTPDDIIEIYISYAHKHTTQRTQLQTMQVKDWFHYGLPSSK